MRRALQGPTVRVVRDVRGLLCSCCHACPTAVVRVSGAGEHLDFCRSCSRRIGVASERLVTRDLFDLEG